MSEIAENVAVPCPKVTIPTADDLEQIIITIGNQYGWEYLKELETLLGAFPLSHAWSEKFDVPELEWENKIQCIIEEFTLYPVIKIAEVVASIAGDIVPLKFPVPPFGVEVDLKELLTNPEYKGTLLKQFQEESEDLINAFLPDFILENWDGTDGVDAPDIKMSKAWSEFIKEVKKITLGNIFAGIGAILDKQPLKAIIEVLEETLSGTPLAVLGYFLKLPTLFSPGGELDFDWKTFLADFKKKIREEGGNLKEELLKLPIPLVSEIPDFLGLDLPETLGDLIDLEKSGKDKKIDMPNWDINKLGERFGTFMTNLPQNILEACLKVLTKIAEVLIPADLPIPFTLCSFMEIIGVPKEISVSNLVTEGT